MPFVTRLVLSSGDRRTLETVVEEVKAAAERKGLDLRGPHTPPPETFSVPRHKRPSADDDRQYPTWSYTVYERTFEFTGHDETVRSLVARELPEVVRRTIEVSQVRSAGGR